MWKCENGEVAVQANGEADAPVWERKDGEPARWYARFEVYRLLGPSRTMKAAHRHCAEMEGRRGRYPNSQWFQIAERWQWRERADAWDQVEREALRKAEKDQRMAAHLKRADMLDVVLDVAFRAMMLAGLDNMPEEQAREAMPSVRLLFKDALNEHRKEIGMPSEGDGDAPDSREAAPFTADELMDAQRELAQWLQTQEQDKKDGNG